MVFVFDTNFYAMLFIVSENKFSCIGPIYYEYGSIVIIYEDSDKAVKALYTLRESKYEDKHLLGNDCQVLFSINFVNMKIIHCLLFNSDASAKH